MHILMMAKKLLMISGESHVGSALGADIMYQKNSVTL